MSFYYYYYSRVYKVFKSISSIINNSIVEWSAMYFVSLFIGMNLITLLTHFESVNNRVSSETINIGLVIMLLVIVINFMIFIRNSSYKKIIKKYNSINSMTYDVLIVLYLLLSLVFFIN